jgi:hypothetical protein
MRLTRPYPRLIHHIQHRPRLNPRGPRITQPRRTKSQHAAVVLGLTDTFSYNMANITGLVTATVFRLYSYRRWVFIAVVEPTAGQLVPETSKI